ncbi:MAG: AI-2E family transporter [Weeksellaceae bacterium]|nr:AI-2E family transporter [Weeksellaceae bacterium]
MVTKKKIEFPFYIKLTCCLISILLLGWFAIIGQTILIPLILGSIISILLVPFCNIFERFLFFPRVLSSLFTTILFFGFITGILYILINQLIDIADEWPAFQAQITELISDLQRWISRNYGVSSRMQIKYLNDNLNKTFDFGTVIIERILSGITRYSILSLFTFLYIVFILIYRRHLIRFVFYIFHERQHKDVLSVIYNTQNMVKQYLIGLFLQMLIVSVLTYISLSFLGVKYSFVLALLTGILNIVPYVGITISVILSAILTLATGSPSQVLFVFIAYIIVHAIDGNIVMPKIVGSKVKVNSLIIIIGLVIGEMTWGIMGMFLSIPILAMGKIIFDHIPDMKPWGFLLGEEKSEKLNPNVENYFRKNRKKFFQNQKKNNSGE